MPTPNTTIQDQLIAARRDQILEAATTVFAEKGFQRATIKDVARLAGVADGTIYNYFENKTALMLGLLDRLNETGMRPMHFTQAKDTSFPEFFSAYLKHRLDQFGEREMALMRIVISEVLVNPELLEQYKTRIVEPTYAVAERAFQALVDAKELPPIDVPFSLRIVTATMLGLFVLRLYGDARLEAGWSTLPDVLTKLMLEGLLAQEGGTK